jgi:hypothetical protein
MRVAICLKRVLDPLRRFYRQADNHPPQGKIDLQGLQHAFPHWPSIKPRLREFVQQFMSKRKHSPTLLAVRQGGPTFHRFSDLDKARMASS